MILCTEVSRFLPVLSFSLMNPQVIMTEATMYVHTYVHYCIPTYPDTKITITTYRAVIHCNCCSGEKALVPEASNSYLTKDKPREVDAKT